MEDFVNKNIWIIGASSGIGKALANHLAGKGANIILSARSEDTLKKVKDNLKGPGHRVFPVDVSDSDALDSTAKAIKAACGKINSIVFLAAIYGPGSLDEIEPENISKLIDINLKGAFYIAQTTLPILKDQGYGQLALCGSVAGYRGLPKSQPYSATKAAIINLAESLNAEEGHKGLDIKVINPGFVETPMTDKNKFEMPMKIKPEEAANRSRTAYFQAPSKFTSRKNSHSL